MNEELKEKVRELERQIKLKDKYCELIHDIGFDYDGYNDVDNLKKIIDELVAYSVMAKDNDDRYSIYNSIEGKKYNILMEEIKDENI